MNHPTTPARTTSLPPAHELGPVRASDTGIEGAPASGGGTLRVGLIGARGHTGAELLRLIADHDRLSLGFASSRAMVGEPVSKVASGYADDVAFVDTTPELAGADVNVFILALPNDVSHDYVRAIDEAHGDSALIVDLSADHRFDSAWIYGLPECNAGALSGGGRRIANPGCYATAMMLTLTPLVDQLDGPPACFGVSGYSGAGATPSPRNDPAVLRDNLMPYALADHVHEREVFHQLGRPVQFMPHVASFFRGISMTTAMMLRQARDRDAIVAMYQSFYEGHPLVRVLADGTPLVRDAADNHHASIGGITVSATDPRQVRVVATLDNLLKGAATQAIQNINIACGFDPLEGLTA